jgi:hypothetical protein
MSIVTDVAKQVIRDRFVAEIETAKAKLQTMKAEAPTVKSDFEVKAITELLAKRREILHKLRQARK